MGAAGSELQLRLAAMVLVVRVIETLFQAGQARLAFFPHVVAESMN